MLYFITPTTTTRRIKNRIIIIEREIRRAQKEERSWCDSNINDARGEQKREVLKVVNADDEKREQQPPRTVRVLVCSFIFEKKTTEEKTFCRREQRR